MNDASTDPERTALELLPWYVNGTLAAPERETVQRALRSSLTLRLELERLTRLQSLVRSDDAELAATDRGFEKLMARIAADDVAGGVKRPSLHALRGWPLAAAASIAALAAGLAWWPGGNDAGIAPARYETLTAEPESGPQLRLVFAPDVGDAERQAILAGLGVVHTAPPTAEGLYTLELPPGADAREIAERLRPDPRIAFVTLPPAAEPR
jgi:hypothetical protein